MEKKEMPTGFVGALAMNPEAMEKFATLPENKKQKIISGARLITSKSEMQQYVEKILSSF